MIFLVCILATREITVFVYQESEGGKGSNEVYAMLKWYIQNKIGKNLTSFYLFGDNCSGQNKNNSLVRMMMGLCETKRFNKVHIIFPVRGHSSMPNDWDTRIIRRKHRKEERYYIVDEVVELIKRSSKNPNKFSIVKIHVDNWMNYKDWWPKYYKRACLSDSFYGKNIPGHLKIAYVRCFRISKNDIFC